MSSLLRLSALLTVCLAALGGALAVSQRVLGIDAGFHDLAVLARETRRRDDLEEENERVRQREEARKQAVEAIVDRRLHLMDAAAEFRRIDLALPYSRPYPSEEEQCRQVLIWVRLELPDQREEKASVLSRLQTEYEVHFHHGCSRDVLGEPTE
jgi:hypothetical protein